MMIHKKRKQTNTRRPMKPTRPAARAFLLIKAGSKFGLAAGGKRDPQKRYARSSETDDAVKQQEQVEPG